MNALAIEQRLFPVGIIIYREVPPMNPQVAVLLENIKSLELDLEVELAKQSANLRFGPEHGRIAFEEELLLRHRELRTSLVKYLFNARLLTVVTTPLIYALIVPLALLDLFVSIYQAACFPVYGIVKVRRGDYFVFDRRFLPYLNAVEKFNCAYCSYATGLIAYAREIASRTEEYWCPIKHARRVIGTHARYSAFEEFGDGEGYRAHLPAHRRSMGKPE
jgi:hypothetical protein